MLLLRLIIAGGDCSYRGINSNRSLGRGSTPGAGNSGGVAGGVRYVLVSLGSGYGYGDGEHVGLGNGSGTIRGGTLFGDAEFLTLLERTTRCYSLT